MCCLVAIVAFIGPRVGILVWWLTDRARWEIALNHFFWGLLGFLFVPWTTLAYVLVAPGGVNGFDWFWIVLGVLIDISNYTGGEASRRRRSRR